MCGSKQYVVDGYMVQCGAPKIAKLVNITPTTMVYDVYDTYIYSFHRVYKPTYNWWAPHCMWRLLFEGNS